jgi:hypothetical protein
LSAFEFCGGGAVTVEFGLSESHPTAAIRANAAAAPPASNLVRMMNSEGVAVRPPVVRAG